MTKASEPSCAIVNSRPLTVETLSDVNSPAPLTPNNLLTMKAEIILSPPGNFEKQNLFLFEIMEKSTVPQ